MAPTPVFLPGESQGWRSLVGCRLRVAQSWTRLMRLSSSRSARIGQWNTGSGGVLKNSTTPLSYLLFLSFNVVIETAPPPIHTHIYISPCCMVDHKGNQEQNLV